VDSSQVMRMRSMAKRNRFYISPARRREFPLSTGNCDSFCSLDLLALAASGGLARVRQRIDTLHLRSDARPLPQAFPLLYYLFYGLGAALFGWSEEQSCQYFFLPTHPSRTSRASLIWLSIITVAKIIFATSNNPLSKLL